MEKKQKQSISKERQKERTTEHSIGWTGQGMTGRGEGIKEGKMVGRGVGGSDRGTWNGREGR